MLNITMHSLKKITLASAILGLVWPSSVRANVTLPGIISNHMVLQKSTHVPIWGKADAGEEITVSVAGKSGKATAGADGKWMVSLDLSEAQQGPFEMTVKGKNSLTISDVVVGEVWVAGGQSNMVFSLANAIDAAEELPKAGNPLLRQYRVERATSATPVEMGKGVWQIATPQTAAGFSAVGYYFGKILQNKLQVPVGLISTNWGGTPIESWLSAEALDSVPDLKAGKDRLLAARGDYEKESKDFAEHFEAWLKETHREDRAAAEVATFTGDTVPEDGWVNLKLPGPVAAAGLPASGAIWLRKEIDVPDNLAQHPLRIDLGFFDGFDSVYWNGKLLRQITPKNYPGAGAAHIYDIPSPQVKAGKNVLVVRIFAPVAAPVIKVAPKSLTVTLDNEWKAKSEYELPPLAAEQLAAVPQPAKGSDEPQKMPSSLFNGMVNPVIPYAIRGVLWYQGEANAGRAFQYRTALPLLITDWRKRWMEGDFPFYICQLANFMAKKTEPAESAWAELRDAQSSALKLPNTGRAVLIDLGESGDIHPRHKREVGERLAKIALARDYKIEEPYSGPSFESSAVEGEKIRVKFGHTDGGLAATPLLSTYIVKSITGETAPLVRNSPNSEVEGFAICGADHKWVWADAKIDGNTVLVWSEKVPAPVAVRYAWADNPTCNLANGAGLPASPFKTDDFPAVTKDQKY